jgi:ParB/RepB/Spo0J family partition protein
MIKSEIVKIKKIKMVSNHRGKGDVSGLMESIKEEGQLIPLIVMRDKGYYRLISGHRRLEAMTKLGLEECRVEIYNKLSEKEIAIKQAIENETRKSLSVLERYVTYKSLKEEHGFSNREIGVYLGVSTHKVKQVIESGTWLPSSFIKDITYREQAGNTEKEGKVSINIASLIANESSRSNLKAQEVRKLWKEAKKGATREKIKNILNVKKMDPTKPIDLEAKSDIQSIQIRMEFTDKQIKHYGGKSALIKVVRELIRTSI